MRKNETLYQVVIRYYLKPTQEEQGEYGSIKEVVAYVTNDKEEAEYMRNSIHKEMTIFENLLGKTNDLLNIDYDDILEGIELTTFLEYINTSIHEVNALKVNYTYQILLVSSTTNIRDKIFFTIDNIYIDIMGKDDIIGSTVNNEADIEKSINAIEEAIQKVKLLDYKEIMELVIKINSPNIGGLISLLNKYKDRLAETLIKSGINIVDVNKEIGKIDELFKEFNNYYGYSVSTKK